MIVGVPVQVPTVDGQRLAVARRAGDRRQDGVDRRVRSDRRRSTRGVGGGAAAGVRAGDAHADRAADVGRGERVGRAGRAGDVGAARARGVAAPPLVGVGDRRRARPGADGGRQRLAVARGAARSSAARCSTGGSATTTAVCAEVACALPATFVAVTRTRIVAPTSAGVSVRGRAVAPAMSAQAAPAALQRCHW